MKFSIEVESGSLGSYYSLDFILGQNWDIIPAEGGSELDTLIKSLKFTEYRDYMKFSIRCQLTATEGRFKNKENHRRSVRGSLKDTSGEYF